MAIQLKNYDPALMQGASVDVNVDLGEILDPNGNEMLEFDSVASAVNFARLVNAATGNPVELQSQGDDTNIGLTLKPKGTGTLLASTAGATTTTAFDIVCSGLTTGTGIDLTDADALTSGKVISVASNSSDTTARSVVQIKQDHLSASGATPLEVWQDGTLSAIKLTGLVTKGIDMSGLSGTARNFMFTATTLTPAAPSATTLNSGWVVIDIGGAERFMPFYT